MSEKISVNEALDKIESYVTTREPRPIRLDAEACGKVLARTTIAAADTPRFDCAAMDGFALAHSETAEADAQRPKQFELVADIPASSGPRKVPLGAAAPISTGAPLPAGTDSVIAKERCRLASGKLIISEPVSRWRNVRRQGEDMAAGALVASAGSLLSPTLIGALLAYGVSHVSARSLPRVQILPTGSEFAAAPTSASAARVDCNGPMIGAMCRTLGLQIDLADPIPDNAEELHRMFQALQLSPSPNLVLSTGGVSIGPHDLVRAALEKVGAQIVFHGIAMRPGKPLLFAMLPNGRPFFGLPGNPVAAFVGFRFFVLAAIRRMLALEREWGSPIDAPQPAREGVTQYLRASANADGTIVLANDQRSHVMRSLIDSEYWVRLEGGASETSATLFPQLPSLRA
jgi:molybdopterin molybdotransferase